MINKINNENTVKELKDIMNRFNVVGLSILLIKSKEVVLHETLGYSDINSMIKTNENTKYRMASISKCIIAVAIMKLYEDDKLKLDDDINKYLKDFKIINHKYPNEKITFKMLLTHTSSIIDTEVYSSIYDSIEFGDYKVGGGFEYSNYGYNLLASLVEVISNKDFEEFVIENIFKPLDMDASYTPSKLKNVDDLAVLYRVNENGVYDIGLNDKQNMTNKKQLHTKNNTTITLGNAFKYGPTGGVRTSPKELSKFMMMLMNKGIYKDVRILKKETIEMMETIEWSDTKKHGVYDKKGLGLHIVDDLIQGYRVIGHAGEAYSLLSGMYYNREHDFGYIMMTNGSNYSFEENGFSDVENEIAKIVKNIIV